MYRNLSSEKLATRQDDTKHGLKDQDLILYHSGCNFELNYLVYHFKAKSHLREGGKLGGKFTERNRKLKLVWD